MMTDADVDFIEQETDRYQRGKRVNKDRAQATRLWRFLSIINGLRYALAKAEQSPRSITIVSPCGHRVVVGGLHQVPDGAVLTLACLECGDRGTPRRAAS